MYFESVVNDSWLFLLIINDSFVGYNVVLYVNYFVMHVCFGDSKIM